MVKYDRKYWNAFKNKYGTEFNSNSELKPLIYFQGYTEDNVDPMNWVSLKISIWDEVDIITLTVRYYDDTTLVEREIMLGFEDIEEVQTVRVIKG